MIPAVYLRMRFIYIRTRYGQVTVNMQIHCPYLSRAGMKVHPILPAICIRTGHTGSAFFICLIHDASNRTPDDP